MPKVQYSELFGGYIPSGETVKSLPAGAYGISMSSQGAYFSPLENGNDSLVPLPDSLATDVIDEVATFWKKRDVYKQLGVKHKRGYLLHGPPGSGKTSTIAGVCKGVIDAGGVVVYITDSVPMINAVYLLSDFRRVEPERPIVVVFEDIDTLIEQFGEASVLNLLDGSLSINSAVYIATTNYIDKLEARIANRPSRFDKVVYVGMPSENDRRAYLKAKVPGDIESEKLDHWARITEGFSIAHLKETIVGVYGLGESIATAVERVRNMGKIVNSSRKVGFGVTSDPASN